MPRIKTKRIQIEIMAAPDVPPTPEQLTKGEYGRTIISGTFGQDGDNAGNHAATRHHDVDAISGMKHRGQLDERQMSSVRLYRRAYRLAFGGERIASMSWGPDSSVLIHGHLTAEDIIANDVEAREDIARFDKEIFIPIDGTGPDRLYFNCWQDVVLFDKSLAQSGSRMIRGNREAHAVAARIAVSLICNRIAEKWRL